MCLCYNDVEVVWCRGPRMDTPVLDEIVKKIRTLPVPVQRQVLVLLDAIKHSLESGKPGGELLQFAGLIPEDDLARMRQAIETGCEQADPHEW